MEKLLRSFPICPLHILIELLLVYEVKKAVTDSMAEIEALLTNTRA